MKKTRRKIIFAIVALLLILAAGLFSARSNLTKFRGISAEYAQIEGELGNEVEQGIAYFAFGDFSSLTSDALRISASPWKLSTAALALAQTKGNLATISTVDISSIFRRFGFHSPQSFGNWPETLPDPAFLSPVGQNVGFAKGEMLPIGATIGNIGCAACHSSVVYREDGSPDTSQIWLGMPNGSINLEAYTQALFNAMLEYGADNELMMNAVDQLYPDTGFMEWFTLRWFILPEMQGLIAERDATIGRLLPFRASLAGATNGLDSLKRRLGMIPDGTVLTESIFNSIPDLGGRLWRTKLLNSGSYAIPGIDHNAPITAVDIDETHRRSLAGIIAYFTVPSMGVTPEVAETSIEQAFWITSWMQTYKPQPFPGSIDAEILPEGRRVYRLECASCHGVYDDDLTSPSLVAFPNWEGDVGTDPQRARLLTREVSDRVNASIFGRYIAARTVNGYTAPPLVGIWGSAPYFHNGSVPTLWHLMNPETRPVRFQVGGHRLDLDLVGIAGQADADGNWLPSANYQPWSIPANVDTAEFGLSHSGHEVEFANLGLAEKQALLEYLKLL